jgi:S1-C subfamily serine protease
LIVVPKSPAATGQLAPGDLVTHVNRKPVPNVAALRAVLDPVAQAGSVAPITFLVLRGPEDEPHAVTITPPRK